MIATPIGRLVLLFAAFAVTGGTALFAIQQLRREPPVDTGAAVTAPADSRASAARDQGQGALAKAQADIGALATALSGTPASPDSGDGVPAFDIARIEATGEAVIAGRAKPGATVELLRNGVPHDRVVADQSGQFAMVPPRLPSGTYDLTLRSTLPDGKQVTSRQNVAVALEANVKDQPVVALMSPDKPTVVLSQPGAPKTAVGAVAVETVEIAPDGKFHVSGRAGAGATVRFYLNDSFVSPVTAGPDGRLSVTINEGVKPGSYRVRLDEVEPKSGTVRARAEVPFNAPDTTGTISMAAQTTQTPASGPPDTAPAQRPQLAGAAATAQPDGRPASTVVVPKIATTTVSPGDSLWRISQSTYGAGTRYAVIYKANREQIRNPNMIYPGQIFVLPTQ